MLQHVHGRTVRVGDAAHPHVLIEGDSLSVLPKIADEVGPVDVVYLDPPYNTGKEGWLYEDGHDDWVSFIREALVAVRGALAPGGVVAASIGHQRVHHLALLLAEVFPSHRIHTITVEVSGGKSGRGIRQVAEYVLLAVPAGFRPGVLPWAGEKREARQPWEGLTLSTAPAGRWPNQVYPIIVDRGARRIVRIGASMQDDGDGLFSQDVVTPADGDSVALWPVTRHGVRCSWRLARGTAVAAAERGHLRIDPTRMPGNPNPFSAKYLPAGVAARLEAGELDVIGRDDNGVLVFAPAAPASTDVPTIWRRSEHHTANGTARLRELIGPNRFPYPKSPALVADILRVASGGKRDAVILDPFAGSGTTLDAVAALNRSDGGERRCVLVTNDEGGTYEEILLPRAVALGFELA